MSSGSERIAAKRLRAHQQEYQDQLRLVERLQDQLREDVQTLQAQEGWDRATCLGVNEWVNDRVGVWRVLRRHRYDENRALPALLTTLSKRISLGLHQPVPTGSPYADSPLFYILPLPTFSTTLDQPIVVITLREVQRDAAGSLDDLKEWSWWALEMVRRVLRDWWQEDIWFDNGSTPGAKSPSPRVGRSKRRGFGGEGCVILVDAEGAGYRNLEVELLPTLLSVGHNHFPGIFDAVYVVNAGWPHRSMWTVVKRILPRSALEKVDFLDTTGALAKVFDLDRLPASYGGRVDWHFSPGQNAMLRFHSSHPAYRYGASTPTASLQATLPQGHSMSQPDGGAKPGQASRSMSSASIAEVFYTAQNTPVPSRRNSEYGHVSLPDLRMSTVTGKTPIGEIHDRVLPDKACAEIEKQQPSPSDQRSPFLDDFVKASYAKRPSRSSSRKTSAQTSPTITPLQRIKSLSDFHLYLSPSRLAHIDVLSDSDSDDAVSSNSSDLTAPAAPMVRRRSLTPAVVDPDHTIRAARSAELAARRSRPPLRLHGVAGVLDQEPDTTRSYSDRLMLHHAHILKGYQSALPDSDKQQGTEVVEEIITPAPDSASTTRTDLTEETSTADSTPATTAPPSGMPSATINASDTSSKLQAVSAFSRSKNPWFGYPAMRSVSPTGHTSIVPRYARNRKRDLVKTLLFLFMLRLQTLRDSAERWLGLHHLGSQPWSTRKQNDAATPSEGLAMVERDKAGARGLIRKGKSRWDGDWVWMVIGFFLLRGTWIKALATPLEMLGWDNLRDVLGLG